VGKLLVEQQSENDIWKVIQEFSFIRPNGEIIRIPVGVKTDFASTGNAPGFPKSCVYDQAAVVHDFLYQGEFVRRGLADDILKEAFEAIKLVPRWKIPIMVTMVRIFGGFTYREHSAESIRYARKLAHVPDNGNRPLSRFCAWIEKYE
jgi:hypothetical protein